MLNFSLSVLPVPKIDTIDCVSFFRSRFVNGGVTKCRYMYSANDRFVLINDYSDFIGEVWFEPETY